MLIPLVFFIIFMLLYMTFRSVSEATIVMLSVVYAMTGGVILQWWLGYNFSVAVWVGYIALYGVAVQTGVVMAGLVPILWSTGVGSDIMKPIAAPIIGGMVLDDSCAHHYAGHLLHPEAARAQEGHVEGVRDGVVIRVNWDPIAHLGPITINWYGLGWAAAFLVGWSLVRRWASAQSVQPSVVDDAIVWIMLGSLAGARLYYVIQNEATECAVSAVSPPVQRLAIFRVLRSRQRA